MKTPRKDNPQGKTRKLFIAALVFAVLAGLGTVLYLNYLERSLKKRLAPQKKEMTHVIVASRNLPVGSVVNTSTMSVRTVPKDYVNSDVFSPKQFESIKGAILIKPLQQGKMLAQDYIDLRIPKDFAGTIQPGHRAFSIQVDEINSNSGMVRPGNFIDLFVKISAGSLPSAGENSSGDVIIPILEDVLVLATDKSTARPNEYEFKHSSTENRHRAYNTFTLEVTPKEAAIISLADSRGELVTALRNTADTSGILFSKIDISDLITNTRELLEAAVSKRHNRNLSGIHLNSKGQLVTRDGIVIKDPNVHLNSNGLVVTKDGTVLSGRDLIVGRDGHIRTADGKLVDTSSLVAGKDGTLVDSNGTVLGSNGYKTAKGGFLIDRKGHVVTSDGQVLSGLTVGRDGRVRTRDGRVVTASQLSVGKDGRVHFTPAMTVNKDGTITDSTGKVYTARDLVTVGRDGTVRAKDGTKLPGIHLDKNGKVVDENGKPLTAAEIVEREKQAGAGGSLPFDKSIVLKGVSATQDPDFLSSIGKKRTPSVRQYIPYEVEYIVGGASSGSAKTFKVQIEDDSGQTVQKK
ncbi:Flp pilus assembly protein CpaB [Desulfomarina sp.]